MTVSLSTKRDFLSLGLALFLRGDSDEMKISPVTHCEIVDYWASRQSECGLSVDWDEAKNRCWRCTGKRKLQRCHIVPRSLGGGEQPSNLVLLCAQCHSEAPNVADPEFMWTWLRAHAAVFYGGYWQQRGFQEYEVIFGEKPFSRFSDPETTLLRVCKAMKELLQKTSVHWGQGKINPATVAWVLRRAEDSAGEVV